MQDLKLLRTCSKFLVDANPLRRCRGERNDRQAGARDHSRDATDKRAAGGRRHPNARRSAGKTACSPVEKCGHQQIERGILDITLYRDDLSEVGPRPMVRPTHIDTGIDGKPLLLVDDVLFTGRTVRAGLNALADFGRPSAIRLAVLVDRGGRELPIQPDFVALVQRDVPVTHRVKVKLTEQDGSDEIVIDSRTAAAHERFCVEEKTSAVAGGTQRRGNFICAGHGRFVQRSLHPQC